MDRVKKLNIPAKPEEGSSVNGGELLMLALAHVFAMIFTGRRQRTVYRLTVCRLKLLENLLQKGHQERISLILQYRRNASYEELQALKQRTKAVAEIQNTLRVGIDV